MVVVGEGGLFLINEVPLYREGCSTRSTLPLQGYFAHNGSVKRVGLADLARPHVNSLELTFGFRCKFVNFSREKGQSPRVGSSSTLFQARAVVRRGSKSSFSIAMI